MFVTDIAERLIKHSVHQHIEEEEVNIVIKLFRLEKTSKITESKH